MYDLVIRNGTVVDGSGAESYQGDVAIADGRIVATGDVPDSARSEIDAEGHVVTPGFIDGHTHMDAQVFWDPLGSCSCWHGVTTVVMGNCGFTLAPARPDERALVVRNLERAEDISAAAMDAGIEWSWGTFREYLDAVDRLPKGINYAANIGHSALRTWAMGERAFDGAATDDDMKAMETELADALRAGAIGFTTSRSWAHSTSDDRPVASRLATWDEVCRLVGLMGELGTGMFELAGELYADPAERKEFHGRLRDLAVASGVPTTMGVVALREQPNHIELMNLIESTVAAGGHMFGSVTPRGLAYLLSFKTRLPFDAFPEWREIRSLDPIEQQRAFRDAAVRERLVAAAEAAEYRRSEIGTGGPPRYDEIEVLEHPSGSNPTVAEMAARRGMSPVELMIDLAAETNLDQLFVQPMTSMNSEELLSLLKHPRNVMTFSDSGAHVSQIMDSSIHTYFLAHWVRERQDFTLEEAVRMMTLAPATAWGFSDRGLVREGFIADLNVFDPERVGPAMPSVTHDLPGGAKRLKQGATGILATVVSGEIVHRDGEHTGALPGSLLRNL